MKEKIEAHTSIETITYEELFPEHEDRHFANQTVFDNAKRFLKQLYGGKRCIVCEMRGETPTSQIESHHVFEWSHWNHNDLRMVEVTLRALSPFIHGVYLVDQKDILMGKPIPSLWNQPTLKGKPFVSLDDPRNQFFLCHAHHQQSTKEQIAKGYDVLGIHHAPFTIWLQYMGMPTDTYPALHTMGIQSTQLDPEVE